MANPAKMVVSREAEEFLSNWGVIHRALAHGASDIHFCVGTPPTARVHGEMMRLEPHALSAEQVDHLIRFFTDRALLERYATQDLDYTLDLPVLQRRFRVNLFRQLRGPSIAMRVLPQSCRTLAELGVPPAFEKVVQEKSGLILVTGATGSGKSTTLAAVLELVNRTQAKHIITIEDPIEFVFQERKCVIEQREVKTHIQNFHEALRSAMRQSPDIILVGEIRDGETAQMALRAAQVGVLVLATLHTRSAAESIARYLSMFEDNWRGGVRLQLADCLRTILCQKLLPRVDGEGRVAACEMLWGTSGVRHIVRDDKLHLLHSFMEIASKDGMVTMEQSILDAHRRGHVGLQTAFEHCNDQLAFLSQLTPEQQKAVTVEFETDVELKRLEQTRETQRRQMMVRAL